MIPSANPRKTCCEDLFWFVDIENFGLTDTCVQTVITASLVWVGLVDQQGTQPKKTSGKFFSYILVKRALQAEI